MSKNDSYLTSTPTELAPQQISQGEWIDMFEINSEFLVQFT